MIAPRRPFAWLYPNLFLMAGAMLLGWPARLPSGSEIPVTPLPSRPPAARMAAAAPVVVVPFQGEVKRRLSDPDAGWPSVVTVGLQYLGTPYRWGGTRPDQGIDCSNFTWQIFREAGATYPRFLSTRALARVRDRNGLSAVSPDEARPGDMLVYGYDEDGSGSRWHGHVVILVDPDGSRTGHAGLVLGAHGGDVDAVRLVTYDGYSKGYFRDPRMRLLRVLRAEDGASGTD